MADDLQDRGPQDAARVSMGEEHEVRYWTGRFGVSREELQEAADAVGSSAAAIEAYLGKERSA